PLKGVLATYDKEKQMGTANRGRYSSPALDALIDKGLATMDLQQREKLYQEAAKLAMNDVAFIPLVVLKFSLAMRDTVSARVRPDDYVLPYDIKPVRKP